MVHEFYVYCLNRLQRIGTHILGDLFKVCNLIWLNFELLYNAIETQKSNVLKSHDASSKYKQKNLAVYQRMKEVLNYFHILPLPPRDAMTYFLVLRRIPEYVWKNIIPFPNFFFEDTIANAVVDDGKIFVSLPPTIPVPTIILRETTHVDEVSESFVLRLPVKEYLSIWYTETERGNQVCNTASVKRNSNSTSNESMSTSSFGSKKTSEGFDERKVAITTSF